jgi:hypothetical protein
MDEPADLGAGGSRTGDTSYSVESARQPDRRNPAHQATARRGQNQRRHALATAFRPRLDIPKGHEYADSPVHLMVPGMPNKAWGWWGEVPRFGKARQVAT